MGLIAHAVDAGAAALVKGSVVTDRVTGDVLHDHDWTPMEAARVVLEAANYAGAVELLQDAAIFVDTPDTSSRDLWLGKVEQWLKSRADVAE